MKKSRKQLIQSILILAVAMGVVGAFYLIKIMPEEEAKKNAGKIAFLDGVKKNDIVGMVSYFKDTDTNGITTEYRAQMEKRSEGWFLTKPVDDRIDPEMFKNLETALIELKSDMVLTNLTEEQIRGFHFDKPSSAFKIILKGDKTIEIVNGSMATTENFYYTMVNGDTNKIYMTYAYKFSALERHAGELRVKDIFDIRIGELGWFSVLSDNGKTYTFELDKNGVWQILTPYMTNANDYSVKSRYLDLTTIRVSEFLEHTNNWELLSQAGLDKPANRVVAVSQDNRTNELVISALSINGFRYAYSPQRQGIMLINELNLTNKLDFEDIHFLPKSE